VVVKRSEEVKDVGCRNVSIYRSTNCQTSVLMAEIGFVIISSSAEFYPTPSKLAIGVEMILVFRATEDSGMSFRTSDRSRRAAKPCRRVTREGAQRVAATLEAVLNTTTGIRDPIMEQLKRCPEAFKVGEILGNVFDSAKYGQEEVRGDQLLPPAGTIIPPLV
jgi:hypothetical protein